MKKILLFFLTFCLSLSFLTGCQNGNGTSDGNSSVPQNEKELWDKINETMDSLDSYETNTSGVLSLTMMGIRLTTDITGKNIVSGIKGNDYYEYSLSEVSATMIMPDGTSTEITNEKGVEAFHNGKMFISMEGAERTQKFCSSLTKDEYIIYRKAQSQDMDQIDFSNCTKSSFAKNEDGTWSLSYSGYAKKTINQILDSFGMNDNSGIDFDISDMEVSIQADQDYRVKEMNLVFLCDEDENEEMTVTSFEIVMQYANFNAATPITDSLNPADYMEIPDCRILFGFEEVLKGISEQKEGSFTLNVTQAVEFPELQKAEIYKETDTVTYGEKDGGYFYHILIDSNSPATNNLEISYANGTQTTNSIYAPDSKQTKEQTEEEAKNFIRNLIGSVSFTQSSISDLSIFADQVYVIQCETVNITEVSTIFAAYGGEMDSVRQTIYITVTDGKMTEIKSNIFAEGIGVRNGQYAELLVTVSTTCTFHQ